jgi:hypothetical protein
MVLSLFRDRTPPLVTQSLQRLNRQHEQERLLFYSLAWAAYDGRMPAPLKGTKSDPNNDDSLTVNHAGLVVDTTVAYLFGDGVRWEVELPGQQTAETDDATSGEDESIQRPEEAWLEDCHRANDLIQTLHKTATDGAICGHWYLKVVLDDPDMPQDEKGRRFPRIIPIEPDQMTVITDEDDVSRPTQYIQQWTVFQHHPTTGTITRAITRRQRTVRANDRLSWTIYDEESGDALPSTFRAVRSVVWPYPWAPIHDAQHLPMPGAYYGRGEIEPDIILLNHSINFSYSNQNRIDRNFAHPRTVATGFSGKQLTVGPDEMTILPHDNAKVYNVEMDSDLSGSRALLEAKEAALFRRVRTPPIAFGDASEASNLSAVALAVRFRPLEQKIKTLRLTYGAALSRLNEHLLALGGFAAPRLRVNPVWPALLPTNPLEEAQTAQLHTQLGVSSQTTLTRLGYNYRREQARAAREATQQAERDAELATLMPQPAAPGSPTPAGGVEGRPDLDPAARRPSTT